MTNTQKNLLMALIACLAPVAGMAGNIGEPAPPLAVKEWIKGKPWQFKVGTNHFAAGTNIYIIEIFSTSSLSSRACITNLNAVQKGFKDKGVVVIGISEEPVETLKQFVQRDGAMIEYAIAADSERQTVLGLMTPSRQKGVPCAFVVGKDGKLLWYGHPMRGLKELLDAVIAGNYDSQWGRKVEAAQRQMVQYLTFARQKDARTKPAGMIVLAARTNDVGLLCDMAFQIATAPQLPRRDIALANEALDQAGKVAGTNATQVAIIRAVLKFETGNKELAVAEARQAVAVAQDPQDKAKAEILLHNMEMRAKAFATKKTKSAGTNAVTMEMTNQIESATTNRTQDPAGKP